MTYTITEEQLKRLETVHILLAREIRSNGRLDNPNRTRLVEKLKELQNCGDKEICHQFADKALLEFIDDPDITALFDSIEKWYA